MHINFIALTDEQTASHRFRVLKPYEILTELGHKVTIKQFPDFSADINVFHKHHEPVAMIDYMERAGTKKIFDVCDDHFDREHGTYYRKACSLADIITCTNVRMQKRLKELFPDKEVKVFHDPINTVKGEPKWSEKPKVIWFGHNTNFKEAAPWLEQTVKAGLDLTVVSNLGIQGKDFTFVPFQTGWVEENLKNYDIVLLPQGKEPWINMKSENRFVDALNAGCFVIFDNDVLYEDLVPYGMQIDRASALQVAFATYEKKFKGLDDVIKLGQEYVEHNYGDSKLKEQWKEILNGKQTKRKPTIKA